MVRLTGKVQRKMNFQLSDIAGYGMLAFSVKTSFCSSLCRMKISKSRGAIPADVETNVM
jgi:hypothetical protein